MPSEIEPAAFAEQIRNDASEMAKIASLLRNRSEFDWEAIDKIVPNGYCFNEENQLLPVNSFGTLNKAFDRWLERLCRLFYSLTTGSRRELVCNSIPSLQDLGKSMKRAVFSTMAVKLKSYQWKTLHDLLPVRTSPLIFHDIEDPERFVIEDQNFFEISNEHVSYKGNVVVTFLGGRESGEMIIPNPSYVPLFILTNKFHGKQPVVHLGGHYSGSVTDWHKVLWCYENIIDPVHFKYHEASDINHVHILKSYLGQYNCKVTVLRNDLSSLSSDEIISALGQSYPVQIENGDVTVIYEH